MNLVNNLKIKIKLLFNYNLPGKFSEVRNNDIYIVSYPKSGNTWMRFLFGNILFEGDFDFANMNEKIPDIYHKDKKFIDNLKCPRVIKSHEPYYNSLTKAKVIYIYRDPRDVVVSYYFWHKKFAPNSVKNFEDYFEKFMKGKLPFGLWSQHVHRWKEAAINNPENIYIIKYEDLKESPFEQFKRVLNFCNIDSSDNEKIQLAIKRSSFKSMKKKEEEQEKASLFKNTNTSIKFVRSGQSDWPKILTKSQLQRMENEFGENFKEFSEKHKL